MATTTPRALTAKFVSVIEALTPTSKGDIPFRELVVSDRLPEGFARLRRFEVLPDAGPTTLSYFGFDEARVTQEFRVRVVYPSGQVVAQYGPERNRAMDAVIQEDAWRILNAIADPDNYLAAQHLADISWDVTDGGDDIVLLELVVTVQYVAET